MVRGDLSGKVTFDRDVKEMRAPAMWILGGELGTASAKALRNLHGTLRSSRNSSEAGTQSDRSPHWKGSWGASRVRPHEPS